MSMSSLATGGTVADLKTYHPEAGRFDELLDAEGRVRPHWQALLAAMQEIGPEEMALRYRAAESIIAENGMTYNVYGDPRGMDRPWALDLMPVVLPADEWAEIERGVSQRLRLMNAVMADLYGPQRMMFEGVLPPEFIFANPHYLRPCHGLQPRKGAYVLRYAADLVRGEDGRWMVYNDRGQAPSGAGYALENRIVMSRTFPNLLADMHVRRLAAFFDGFRSTLRHLSGRPQDNPTIVLLTPGPHNETYFEHVYLARYLGFPLVEGGDLTVRDDQVYLKTVQGLRQVDGMWRRVDDAFSDPLELIKNSTLGTPGLLQALRAGNLFMCNSIGCAALDVSAIKAVLPALCQRLLGEDLQMPCTRTLWGAIPEHRAEMSQRVHESPLLSAFMPPMATAPSLGQLEADDRDAMLQAWETRPYDFVMLDNPRASTVPVMRNGRLEACGLMLRVYATLSVDGGCSVMPGGLARFSSTHDPTGFTMQGDSGSKDVWVLSDEPVDFTSLLGDQERPLNIIRSPQNVSSRLAENLLWLGRYCERAEVVVRFLRYVLLRSSEEEGIRDLSAIGTLLRGSPKLFEALASQLTSEDGEIAELSSHHLDLLHHAVLEAVFNPEFPNSVTANLLAIRRAAWSVRERFSEDDWRILIGFVQEFLLRSRDGSEIRNCLDALNRLVAGFASFSGLIVENMTKEPGQVFLDMGRRIERAAETSDVLLHTLPVLQGAAPPVLRGLLSIFDSPMTYAARYGAQMQEGPVLDLLLADETNPRAVAYQLNILSRHLAVLPKRGMPGLLNTEERIVEHLLSEVRVADMTALARPEADGTRPRLAALLETLNTEMCRFADEVSMRYFIHTGPARALEPSQEFDP